MSDKPCCHSTEIEPPVTIDIPKGDCCGTQNSAEPESCHDHQKTDWIFWGSLLVLVVSVILFLLPPSALISVPVLERFAHAQVGLIQDMWLGMLIGVISIGLMDLLPKSTIMSALGSKRGLGGIFRAAAAGIVLDLCNHGLLLIAGKLYRSGVRYSQVLAFLIASPWNSLSLTIVMFALLGWQWTLTFIGLSFVVAVIAGWVIERLEDSGKIAENPHSAEALSAPKIAIKQHIAQVKAERGLLRVIFIDSFKDSKMIMRWLLLGMVLAALIKTFLSDASMQTWFGPTLLGLGLTLIAATVIEVCSEGLLPVAADLLTRAAAPGNAFTFMMAGVSTDYTEILVLKETTGRWKTALLLPLVTLPQILILGVLLNQFS